MKKCPYCAEEIQDEAIKCRYCGSSGIPSPMGVCTSSRLSNRVLKYLKESGIVEDENILLYYDGTLSQNLSKLAILTNKNIISYESEKINKIPLNQIKSVTGKLVGGQFHIVITPEVEQTFEEMKIEIVGKRDGVEFLSRLRIEKGRNRNARNYSVTVE